MFSVKVPSIVIASLNSAMSLALIGSFVWYKDLTAPPSNVLELLQIHDSFSEYMVPPNTVVERETEWLAKAIYFESRDQSVAGQTKVAEVVMKRVLDPRWPNSVEGVVRQGESRLNRCQFSFMCDGKPETINDEVAWQLAYDLAHNFLMREIKGEKVAGCAHSYHATYATNVGYFAKLDLEDQVGTHIFYCDKGSVS